MRETALLIAAALFVVMTSTAQATIRITADPGGLIGAYADRFQQARASGEPVMIDGACLSACTLAIALLPREQVCATRNAVLGFHAAWRLTARGGHATSAVATQTMMDLYPGNVRAWIDRHGGLKPRMIFLRGRELSTMVPTCGAVAERGYNSAFSGFVRTAGDLNAVARATRRHVVRPTQLHGRFDSQSR